MFGALAITRRAGALKYGFDECARALAAGAPMCVVASDISERTLRKAKELCDQRELVYLPFTQYDLLDRVGRRFVVAAVTDRQLATLIRQAMEEA